MSMGLGDLSAQAGLSLQSMGLSRLQSASSALAAAGGQSSAPPVADALDMSALGAQAKSLVTQVGQKQIDMKALDKSAEQFESVFIGQMLEPMFEGIQTDPLFGGGHGEEMFRNMLVNEYGKQMAAHGGFGLAASVKQEMLKAQEKQQRGGKSNAYGSGRQRV